MAEIRARQGDLTKMAVDAIVNAANNALAPGAGVDGAIRRAAGPEMDAATARLDGCATGDAKITDGFDLPARWVVHTVGPVWEGGQANEPALLASCYRRSLEVAAEAGARSIAFPMISTGIYGFPKQRAAAIAVDAVRKTLEAHPGSFEAVYLVAFDDQDMAILEQALADAGP